jgi:hypothetical protein
MGRPVGIKLCDFPPCFLCGRSLQDWLKSGRSCVCWKVLDGHVTVLVCGPCTNNPDFEESCERKMRKRMNAEPAFNPPKGRGKKHG